uniref:hypothetical protein n=1 Tax=Cyathus striatus TaxID=68777 RepID=UPI0023F5773A|nr:hypothetical protein P4C30_mgp34 [Cyathus striatus]WDS46387.1 hypothetical protein [Cyathus striatus]
MAKFTYFINLSTFKFFYLVFTTVVQVFLCKYILTIEAFSIWSRPVAHQFSDGFVMNKNSSVRVLFYRNKYNNKYNNLFVQGTCSKRAQSVLGIRGISTNSDSSLKNLDSKARIKNSNKHLSSPTPIIESPKSKKSILSRMWVGIKKGYAVSIYPPHIMELKNKIYIRILRVSGGLSILVIFAHVIQNIYILCLFGLIIVLHFIYILYSSYYIIKHIKYIITESDQLDVRNSPLD